MTEIFAHSKLAEFEHDGDVFDRYYLPGRTTAFSLNSPESLSVLPETPSLKTYTEQLNQICADLQVRSPRVVWVPDTSVFLDVAMAAHLSELTKQLARNDQYRVWPYSQTPEVEDWLQSLVQEGYQINSALPPKIYFENLRHPQHRGGWGRWVNQPDKLSFPEKYSLPYPKSFIGLGLEEIQAAYRQIVTQTGRSGAYFKPVFSAGGFTIARITSEKELAQHYQDLQDMGSLILFDREMPIEIQEEVNGIKRLASIQYKGDNVATPGGFSLQLVEGTNWVGNLFNGFPDHELRQKMMAVFHSFVEGMQKETQGQFYGWGGLDFTLVDHQGKLEPIILEHNGGRVTGAHPAIALAQNLRVSDQAFVMRKVNGALCDLQTIWDMLKTQSLQFDPSERKGIFPMLWLPGSSFLFASGGSEIDVLSQIDHACNLARRQGYLE